MVERLTEGNRGPILVMYGDKVYKPPENATEIWRPADDGTGIKFKMRDGDWVKITDGEPITEDVAELIETLPG